MSWNAAGGATSSYLKGDNPFTGGLINGLASGVGYGAGKLIELPVDKIYNPMKPWKDWLWTDVGMGISKPLSLDPIPRVAGNITSSIITEYSNDQAGKNLGVRNENLNLKMVLDIHLLDYFLSCLCLRRCCYNSFFDRNCFIFDFRSTFYLYAIDFMKILKGSIVGGLIGAIGCWWIYYQGYKKNRNR